KFLSERDTYTEDRERMLSAHSNLIELYLLARLPAAFVPAAEAEARALEHALQLRKRGRNTGTVQGAIRRLERYVDWFPNYHPGMKPSAKLAELVLKELRRDGGG